MSSTSEEIKLLGESFRYLATHAISEEEKKCFKSCVYTINAQVLGVLTSTCIAVSFLGRAYFSKQIAIIPAKNLLERIFPHAPLLDTAIFFGGAGLSYHFSSELPNVRDNCIQSFMYLSNKSKFKAATCDTIRNKYPTLLQKFNVPTKLETVELEQKQKQVQNGEQIDEQSTEIEEAREDEESEKVEVLDAKNSRKLRAIQRLEEKKEKLQKKKTLDQQPELKERDDRKEIKFKRNKYGDVYEESN